MIRILVLVLFSFFCVSASFSQTPEQSYLDWTTMPFSKEELSQRRALFIELLRRQGETGLVLLPARDGFSYGETFRQLDDFYYFSGLELPNSILAFDMATGEVIVFAPERDLRFENGSRPNDFPGRPLLTDASISSESGLILKSIEVFDAYLSQRVQSNPSILVNSGRPGPVLYASNDYISSPSPEQLLIDALRTRHMGFEFKNIYASIAGIRMIKSSSEVQLMRKAAEITVDGIISTAKWIKPGLTERYLEGVLEGEFKKHGAQRLAFGSIIKSGPNSVWPWRILATHYDRRNRIMQSGELVILDVGCEYNHYVSDVGRTFPVSGNFSDRQRDILIMETGIADQIIEFLEPGVTFNDVKKLTDRIIPEEARKYMQVGLHFGHHLGLSTGDPNIPNTTLQPGMIFTVEPWYYNHDEGISVFTEDIILITAEGHEVLTKKLPRTPVELERLMRN